MSPQVQLQTTPFSESLFTFRADVRLDGAVCPHMLHQTPRLIERFLTLCTEIGLRPTVRPEVDPEPHCLPVGRPTLLTDMRLVPAVQLHVLLVVPRPAEHLAALFTRIGLLPRVGPPVRLEVIPPGEGLVTELALVWPLVAWAVQPQVLLEAVLLREGPVALAARVGLHPRV